MHAMSGASGAGYSPREKMSSLFDSIDTSGSGSISQAQFSAAFATKNPPAVFQNAGADSIWSTLDPAGTGSVSKANFVSTMSGLMASLRATPADLSAGAAGSADTSAQSLQAVTGSAATYTPGSLLDQSI